LAWTGATLDAKFRAITGRGSTDDISTAAVLAIINDYYQEDFPFEIDTHKFLADWTAAATVSDAGEYTLADSDLDLNQPITADGGELQLIYNVADFFRNFPIMGNEYFTTAPTLAIGTTASKVLCAAFKYKLLDWTYSKASTETALSGEDVPQDTYGAWLLSLDDEGAITVTEAADNVTGYATAALAVNGIVLPGSSQAIMGFVTAISSSGAFSPGTTLLNALTVTDTYTDGNPGLRGIPTCACITDGKLFIRPKPMDDFSLRAKSSLSAPTALTAGTAPVDEAWGMAIATGAAMKYLNDIGNSERVAEILGDASSIGTHAYYINRINRKKLFQESERQTKRSW